MKIRSSALAIFLLLAFSGTCFADFLVVMNDGQSFWAKSAEKDGDYLKVTRRGEEQIRDIAIADIEAVISSVVRGKRYSGDEIRKQIARVKGLRAKHKELKRACNALMQEWEAAMKGGQPLGSKIAEALDEFDKSDKGPAAWKRANITLGMINYKDLAAEYAEEIKTEMVRIKRDCIEATTKLIEEKAKPDAIKVEDFLELEDMYKELRAVGGSAVEGNLGVVVNEARKKTLAGNIAKVKSGFGNNRSITSYLHCAKVLHQLLDKVAVSSNDKIECRGILSALRNAAAQANRGYKIDENGFPLSRQDQVILAKNIQYSSFRTKHQEEYVEEACMFPGSVPRMRIGASFSIPLMIVFNREQPIGRKYALRAEMHGQPKTYLVFHKINTLRIQNGHAVYKLSEQFDGLPETFAPGKTEDGRPLHSCRYLLRLMRAKEDGDESGEEWIPISSSCLLSVSE